MKLNNLSFTIQTILRTPSLIGSIVTVNGWVRTRRDSKAGLSFVTLNDGSCFESLQLIAANTLSNYHTEIGKLTAGCAIQATGVLVASPAAGQQLELQITSLTVVGWVATPESYPMAAKYHTPEYLREFAHLRPRTNLIGAVTRIRHSLTMAIHRFFDEHGFYWVSTPIITANDCEGAGELFRVTTVPPESVMIPAANGASESTTVPDDFFGKPAFLTVSGQLNVEAYCTALSKVYTFGPTFRAENSNTSRHLAEFWMVEPEIAFADLYADAELAIGLLRHLAAVILEKHSSELDFFMQRFNKQTKTQLEKLINSEFVYLEYSEAVTALQQSGKKFTFPVAWGVDLQTEHERYLTEELIGGPVIVMNYPKQIKSFYMRLNDDGKTVAAMDILVPGVGEIIGGSQREERYEILYQRLVELGLPLADYQWYLDLRRYGSVPHAGFGLGLERMLMYVTGLPNIRDVVPFPRVAGQISY